MVNRDNRAQKFRELLVGMLVAVLVSLVGTTLSALLVMFPPTPERPDIVLWLGIGTLVLSALVVLIICLPVLQKWGVIGSWRGILRIRPAVMLILLIAAGGYATHWLVNQNSVAVPGLTGKNYGQAASELRDLGLTLDPIRAPNSDDYTPITQQKPLAGTTVLKGAAVEVIVGVLEVRIEITSPADGEVVTQEQIIVEGITKGVAESGGRLHANLLLQPLAADGYWIYGPLTIGEKGEWKKMVFLGQGTGKLPQNYQIHALVTMEPLKPQGGGEGQPEYIGTPRYVAISKIVTLTRSR